VLESEADFIFSILSMTQPSDENEQDFEVEGHTEIERMGDTAANVMMSENSKSGSVIPNSMLPCMMMTTLP